MTNLSLLARFFLLWNGRQFLSMLFLQNFLSWRHRKFPARFQTSFISRSWQDPGLVTSRKCVTIKSPFVFHLNASLREGYIPLQWKSAIVSPIPKSAPALDAVDNDFRPISLTAIISKILESFLYQWHLLSIFDKIDPLQFSSLKGSSTTMALVYLLHKWYDKLGSSLRICLLDFSKAFDRIDHNILLNKLQLMDVHPVLVNWITNCIQLQWRALRIIYPVIAYKNALEVTKPPTLYDSCCFLNERFFNNMMYHSHKISCLIPPERHCRYNLRKKTSLLVHFSFCWEYAAGF